MKEDQKKKQYDRILELLKKYTKHKNVKLVHRGNAAILCALSIIKKINPKPFILIPDQGGWISFKIYPKLLGFDVRTVKTNRGVIDLMDLEKKAESGAAFLVTSFAGYFAEQPMKYISRICKANNCYLIEDASGSIGDLELCDGEYSDFIVGSFGRWKPVNVGYGGFVSCGKKEYFQENEIFSSTNHYPEYTELLTKLEAVPERIKKFLKESEKVTKEITDMGFKVFHPEERGINVVVQYTNDSEKEKIIGYCESNGYEFVECPKYIRVEENAISIEIKRMEFKK